ncbi:MAG TPA: cytochrome c3 family protein [Anaeromyxobacteraceae bacterium]|nr:cytochrome c3 family protein [Anaeromyxobacteraceae bacterium]
MTGLVALLAVVLAVDLAPRPPGADAPEHPKAETRCGACHTPDGWDRVTFDHARTGFALEGAHRTAACRGCHPASDFKRAVPRACVACHRDAHAGRLGTRCTHCHDAVAWREPTFGPDAHRRTGFPLDGRHAVLPCEECHGDRRDRSFARPTRRCAACHGPDLARAAVVAFDHVAAFGNADDCRRCHGAWSFSPGYVPGHDACFPIRTGAHAGIKCLRCHTAFPPFPWTGNCADGLATLACVGCHSTCPPDHDRCPLSSQDCMGCHAHGATGGG